jgi:flavin reductase (DIM6/NTAB) family NADH-FMN oxidoreductase RutF
VDTEAFDFLTARLDNPLVVVTTASGDQRAGCVAGFHTQCGIEPMRYAVWLSKANMTYRTGVFATHLAVHYLDVVDHDLAELFGAHSGEDIDKFARCDWAPGPGGVPFLTRCPNRVVLERISIWDGGDDHACFVGEPVDASRGAELIPLRLSAALDIEPGHAVEERVKADDVVAQR